MAEDAKVSVTVPFTLSSPRLRITAAEQDRELPEIVSEAVIQLAGTHNF